MSISAVVRRTQTLLDDPAGSWADTDYVMGFMALNSEDIAIELSAYGLSYDNAVVVVPAVPANTTDLSAYQAGGQPLQNLMVPIRIDWRQAGATDNDWSEVPPRDRVQDAAPGDGGQGVASYEWRGGTIYLTTCDQAVDLRVRFDQMPTVFDDQAQQEVPGITNALAYSIAAMIWGTRGNAARAQMCQAKADKAKDNFESLMVMKEQKVNRKIGRPRRLQFFDSLFQGGAMGGLSVPTAPGGEQVINFADNEVVQGNGTNWTLKFPPKPMDSLEAVVNLPGFAGVTLFRDIDYSLIDTAMTTFKSYPEGSVRAWYRY